MHSSGSGVVIEIVYLASCIVYRGPWPGETVSGEARRGLLALALLGRTDADAARDLNQRCGPGAPRRHTDTETDA